MSTKPPSETPTSTVSLHRLLRAVSPALEAELERIFEEQKEKLVGEAEERLRTALLEQEAELKTRAGAEQARVLAETADRIRRETAGELESQFEQKLAAELRALKDRLDQASQEAQSLWQRERAELGEESARWRALAEFFARTGEIRSQAGILRQFLEAAHHFAGSVALYLERPGGLGLWGGDEGSAFPELVSEETRDPDWYWVPITIRSRTVLTVAASEVRGREALDILATGLKRAIENLGLRLGARPVPGEAARSTDRQETPVAPGKGEAV